MLFNKVWGVLYSKVPKKNIYIYTVRYPKCALCALSAPASKIDLSPYLLWLKFSHLFCFNLNLCKHLPTELHIHMSASFDVRVKFVKKK